MRASLPPAGRDREPRRRQRSQSTLLVLEIQGDHVSKDGPVTAQKCLGMNFLTHGSWLCSHFEPWTRATRATRPVRMPFLDSVPACLPISWRRLEPNPSQSSTGTRAWHPERTGPGMHTASPCSVHGNVRSPWTTIQGCEGCWTPKVRRECCPGIVSTPEIQPNQPASPISTGVYRSRGQSQHSKNLLISRAGACGNSLYLPLKFQFSSAAESCPTPSDPMDGSTPGFPVPHQLPELTQTHVHQVGDAIQISNPLLSPSPPAFNLSQHQGLFQ